MKETFSSTAKYRKVYLFIGIALIIVGIFTGIVTFFTTIGPFMGLLLVGIGIFLLWSMRQPTETMEEQPSEHHNS